MAPATHRPKLVEREDESLLVVELNGEVVCSWEYGASKPRTEAFRETRTYLDGWADCAAYSERVGVAA